MDINIPKVFNNENSTVMTFNIVWISCNLKAFNNLMDFNIAKVFNIETIFLKASNIFKIFNDFKAFNNFKNYDILGFQYF